MTIPIDYFLVLVALVSFVGGLMIGYLIVTIIWELKKK